jgi:hypothetical protein
MKPGKDDKKCKHCKETVRIIYLSTGKQWMHVDPKATHPTARNKTMWWSCSTVAEPGD